MSAPHSVIFLGTSPFAVPSLRALAADKRFRVDLVVTQPDKPVGRKQMLTPPPVKVAAEELGLKIFQPEKLNAEVATLQSRVPEPAFLVVVSYGQILSQAVLDLPQVAPVNVHASLLPRWRGASPIQHAILSGDRETGVTIQKIVKELDAGPILAQERTKIAPRETYQTLHDRLAETGAALLINTITQPLTPTEQNDEDIVICRRLSRQDGHVDATAETAAQIDRKVRALTPWPGVTIDWKGEQLKILAAELTEHPDTFPLLCRDATTLYLTSVQPAGKKAMTGSAWARGR